MKITKQEYRDKLKKLIKDREKTYKSTDDYYHKGVAIGLEIALHFSNDLR
ncbi:MAG: hypothetical protein ACOCRO_00540 [Halanaerobiales bacterium]